MKNVLLFIYGIMFSLSSYAMTTSDVPITCDDTNEKKFEIMHVSVIRGLLQEISIQDGHFGVSVPNWLEQQIDFGTDRSSLTILFRPTAPVHLNRSSQDPRFFQFDGPISIILMINGQPAKEISGDATIDFYRNTVIAGLGSSDSLNVKASVRVGVPGNYKYGVVEASVDTSICSL